MTGMVAAGRSSLGLGPVHEPVSPGDADGERGEQDDRYFTLSSF